MSALFIKDYTIKDSLEMAQWAHNRPVLGLDEVGRGCLMGPVVTAGVILPNRNPSFLSDSKILSPKARNEAYGWIIKNCLVSIAITNPRCIDKHNIYQATLKTMRRTVLQLLDSNILINPLILVDAMPLNLAGTAYEDLDIYYFYKGEEHSSSIAAASIVAKVTRDALIGRLAPSFPIYAFERHKGYPTALHTKQLQIYGSNLLYRTTFKSSAF